ncbi:hypothetical protein KIW84_043788 [Lathyrus oleraceus]|uniref:Uncharacterized protein n=1 Tax=Pisum sativum TaxID=3888 RepID=A0A9D4XEQ6_PEA|nr:hypothetical protein KIW84_043788 [Pisum sativum]
MEKKRICLTFLLMITALLFCMAKVSCADSSVHIQEQFTDFEAVEDFRGFDVNAFGKLGSLLEYETEWIHAIDHHLWISSSKRGGARASNSRGRWIWHSRSNDEALKPSSQSGLLIMTSLATARGLL